MSADSPQGNNSRFPGYMELREGEMLLASDFLAAFDGELVKPLSAGLSIKYPDVGHFFRKMPEASDHAPLTTALSRIEVLEGAIKRTLKFARHESGCGLSARNPCDCWKSKLQSALSIPPESTGGENGNKTLEAG